MEPVWSRFFGTRVESSAAEVGGPIQLPTEPNLSGGGSSWFANAKNMFSNSLDGLGDSFRNNYDFEDEPEPTSSWTGGLSYFERVSLFVVCMLGCYSCYSICFIFFPVLSLKPRKFALIWSIGSVSFLAGFVILNGTNNFFKHAVSTSRLPFTISFIGSITATLLFSLKWKNNLLVIISCVLQAICSLYYTISYFPYGRQGLQVTTGLARTQVEGWLGV